MEALERFFPLFCSHRIKDHEPINFNSIIPEDKLTDYSKIWKESMMWVQKECKLYVIKNSQLCWPAQSCLTCWTFSWPIATRASSGKISCPDESVFKNSFLLGLLAKIKVFGVLPAHWPLILDEGTVLESIPLLICAGFANCHCTWSLVIWFLLPKLICLTVRLSLLEGPFWFLISLYFRLYIV